MPRLPIDYSKTIMYKLVCNDLSITECYVGHTTDMTKRKNKHKSCCNNEKCKEFNQKKYTFIRENGGWENWSMIMIEEYPCDNRIEAEKQERFWFEELKSKLNTSKPFISEEELKDYYKEYRQSNKDKIKEHNKEYREANKDKINEQRKEYRQANKDKINERQKKYRDETIEQSKEYRKANKDKIDETKRKYRQANKDKINEYQRRRYALNKLKS